MPPIEISKEQKQMADSRLASEEPRDWRKLSAFGSVFILLIGVLTFALYGLDLPLHHDNGIYYYSAQQLLKGVPPYVSIFDIKTPLTSFFVAALLIPSDALFSEPLVGIRLAFIAVSIGTALILSRLSAQIFGPRLTVVVPALSMFAFQGYVYFSAMGARPKVLLLLFMSIALLQIWRRRWFASGIAAGCCAFTWQPAGIVLLGAMAGTCLEDTGRRWHSLLRLSAGFGAVALALAAYFALSGAFSEFVDGSLLVHFFIDRGDQNEIRGITRSILRGFPYAAGLFLLGLGCLFVYLVRRIREPGGDPGIRGPLLSYLVMLVVFIGWSLFDLQSYVDLFVLLPFAALGIQILIDSLARGFPRTGGAATDNGYTLIALFAIGLLSAIPLLARLASPPAKIDTLSNQHALYEEVFQKVSVPDSPRVLALDLPELMALRGLDNLSPYVVNNSGIDLYVASRFQDGFSGFLSSLEQTRPDLILTRPWLDSIYVDEHSQALKDWLDAYAVHVVTKEAVSAWMPRNADPSVLPSETVD